MGSDDLVALAKRFVDLTAEIEDTRRAMLTCLTNGAGGEATRPTHAGPAGPSTSSGEAPPQAFDKSASNRMIEAAASEARIIEVLKQQPGMGIMALAAATSSKKSTTAQRLRRLREKGLRRSCRQSP